MLNVPRELQSVLIPRTQHGGNTDGRPGMCVVSLRSASIFYLCCSTRNGNFCVCHMIVVPCCTLFIEVRRFVVCVPAPALDSPPMATMTTASASCRRAARKSASSARARRPPSSTPSRARYKSLLGVEMSIVLECIIIIVETSGHVLCPFYMYGTINYQWGARLRRLID